MAISYAESLLGIFISTDIMFTCKSQWELTEGTQRPVVRLIAPVQDDRNGPSESNKMGVSVYVKWNSNSVS